MSEAFTGGCLCGAVRYRVAGGRQLPVYACHCTDCQTRSSSAFAMQQGIVAEDLTVEGETEESHTRLPSGAAVRVYSCASCQTRIYTISDGRPHIASLRAGTRDDSALLVPELHFWVKSKQPWIAIPEGVPSIETQPSSFSELNRLFGEPR